MPVSESIAIAYSKIRAWLFLVVVKFASLYYYVIPSPGVSREDGNNDITQGLIYSISKNSNKSSIYFPPCNK